MKGVRGFAFDVNGQSLPLVANVSILFDTGSIHQRLRAAAEAGFDRVEMWWPFSSAVPDRHEVEELIAALRRDELQLVAMNLFAGDMAAGDRGVLSHPKSRELFRMHVPVALGLAERAGCRRLNALYGNTLPKLTSEHQFDAALANLTFAADSAAEIGACVVVEAVNPVENPRFPIPTLAQVANLIEQCGRPSDHLGMLFDVYHVQRTEGDLVSNIARYADLIQHIQIADSPTRTSPGTGEIAFAPVISAIAASGYDGHIGLEYKRRTSDEGFGWIAELNADLAREGSK
jgi:hydroxypyruvate isomerase